MSTNLLGEKVYILGHDETYDRSGEIVGFEDKYLYIAITSGLDVGMILAYPDRKNIRLARLYSRCDETCKNCDCDDSHRNFDYE